MISLKIKEKNTSTIINNRVFYLDLLRVIACLSVILIHASAPSVIKDYGSFNFWIGNILDSLARIAVPLFLMISGALMLDESYNFTSKKLKKHISKMILFFLFWSVIYCVYFNIIDPVYLKHKSLNIQTIILSIITGHYHLWFVYLIIGLYLITPLLRLWVKKENKKYVEYFFALSIIFTFILPQIVSIGSNYSNIFQTFNAILQKKLCLTYVGGYTSYYILGWYMNNFTLKNKKLIILLGIFGYIFTVIGTAILSITTNKSIQTYHELYLNVLLQTIAVFYFIKLKFNTDKYQNFANPVVSFISKNSLGIYAIHAGLISIGYEILPKSFNSALINIPIIYIGAFTLSILISFIFSKLPILKKMV